MDRRRPIRADIDAGSSDDDASVEADRFRDAFARWAATVTIVAVRGGGAGGRGARVLATTVSSFAPLSDRPPLVAICLGTGAQVLPYVQEGSRVGVSVLAEEQSGWATIFSDSFPVRSPEWAGGDAPLVPDSVAGLTCTVRAVHAAEGGSRVVVCHVDGIDFGDEQRPLLYWQRAYRRLGDD